jgi:hypothetical protein
MPKKRVGVTRETADRLLDNLRTRAKEIDADPQYLYGISRLAVLGSYLTAKDKLGDIDIAVELGPKERDPERHWKACDEQRKNGPRGQSFIESISWPELRVIQALRVRHSSFSFHEYRELAALQAKHVVIYQNEKFDRESFFAAQRKVSDSSRNSPRSDA